jgi:hypothetical protein
VLFAENRKTFHHQVIDARQSFLILMNAAKYKAKSKNKNQSEIAFRSSATSEVSSFVNDINSLYENQLSHNFTQNVNVETSRVSDINQDFKKLLNFHIDLHFDRILSKYSVL